MAPFLRSNEAAMTAYLEQLCRPPTRSSAGHHSHLPWWVALTSLPSLLSDSLSSPSDNGEEFLQASQALNGIVSKYLGQLETFFGQRFLLHWPSVISSPLFFVASTAIRPIYNSQYIIVNSLHVFLNSSSFKRNWIALHQRLMSNKVLYKVSGLSPNFLLWSFFHSLPTARQHLFWLPSIGLKKKRWIPKAYQVLLSST